jgi:hypothetical protein
MDLKETGFGLDSSDPRSDALAGLVKMEMNYGFHDDGRINVSSARSILLHTVRQSHNIMPPISFSIYK